jgi:hypothetical protein
MNRSTSAATSAEPGPVVDPTAELDFRLTVAEAEVVLEALGSMRYSTVYRLIAKLQTQARDQAHRHQAARPGIQGDAEAPVDLRDVTSDGRSA